MKTDQTHPAREISNVSTSKMLRYRSQQPLELRLEKLVPPEDKKKFIPWLKKALNIVACGLNSKTSVMATTIAEALDIASQDGMKSVYAHLRDFLRELDALRNEIDPKRLLSPDYRAIFVKVLRDVQFETDELKRRCYRAVLINPLRMSTPPLPQLKREYFITILRDLHVHHILVLRALNDPAQAQIDFLTERQRRGSSEPANLYHIVFYSLPDDTEMPMMEAVLMDLNSRRLIELTQASKSPDSVLGAKIIDVSRILTPFGRELIQFITLPDNVCDGDAEKRGPHDP